MPPHFYPCASLTTWERFEILNSLSPFLYNLAGTKFALPRFALRSKSGENIVIGRQYFVRQAATLVEFARSTNDPELAAGLIGKAADLLAQIDEPSAGPDPSPQAPDVEPPPAA